MVIYRWRLHAGKEQQFRQQWEQGTQRIIREDGGLGSRLHQAGDGSWIAYAQWPSKAVWEQSRAAGVVNPLLVEAIAESFPPILLTPVADYLVPALIEAR